MSFLAFPQNYRDGRAAFLAAAAAAGLGTNTRVHPGASGGDGLPLFLDTVTIGPIDAGKALLVITGTHGVEGYFGSGIVTGLLREGLRPPADAKIVLLHALDPYGFACDRRVDENNIDVNRNIVYHAAPPSNPWFDALADRLAVPDIAPASMQRLEADIRGFAQTHGLENLRRALYAGQYARADGLSFGGHRPSWSADMLRDVLREELRRTEALTVLDLHVGLGDCGVAEIISEEAEGSALHRRAQAIWGRVTSSASGNAISGVLNGGLDRLFAQTLPQTVFATLEIGTVPAEQAFFALVKDNWLYRHGGADHPLAGEIAREMRAAFFPASAEWRANAWRAGRQAAASALTALG
jgi:hypothetical protein